MHVRGRDRFGLGHESEKLEYRYQPCSVVNLSSEMTYHVVCLEFGGSGQRHRLNRGAGDAIVGCHCRRGAGNGLGGYGCMR